MPCKQHHHECRKPGQQWGDAREESLEHEAHEEELHHHPQRCDRELALQPQPQHDGERTIEQHQQGRNGEVPIFECYVAHPASRTRPACTSSRRRAIRRA
jgi:hypothetical protein